MEITANLDTAQVRRRIGIGGTGSDDWRQRMRESTRRQRYLQKLSRVLTLTRPSVTFDQNHPTAQVNQSGDEPQILITSREFDQSATSLADDVFDMTVQEALLVHELGHILYTDNQSFKQVLSRVDLMYKRQFKRLWNTLEDGAIEEQLRNEFNVSDELFVLNANLMEHGGEKVDDKRDVGEYDGSTLDLYSAINLGLMDMAVYDSGNFAKLLDDSNTEFQMIDQNDRDLLEDAIPRMESVVEDVLTTPAGSTRNERIFQFWTEIVQLLNKSSDPQQQQGQDGSGGDDGDGDDSDDGDSNEVLGDLFGTSESDDGDDGSDEDMGGDAQPVPGKPDDTENAGVGQSQSADELEDTDPDDIQDQIEQAQESPQSEMDVDDSDDGDDSAHGTGDKDEVPDQDDQTNGPESGPDLDNLEERRRDNLRQEANEVEGNDAMMDEIEEYSQIMSSGAGDIDSITMNVPEHTDRFDRARWRDAKQNSKQPEQILRSHLRQERRARTVRNQRRGRFDSGNLVNASRGDPRVFENTEEGDEKEYEVMFVLDRSYSMNGPRMEAAEEALSSLSIAMEELGIKVSVVDMYNNDARLISPLDAEVERDREKLMTSESSGGTPLSDAIALARERMGKSNDEPFMVVITDGQPDYPDQYMDELDQCTFPVLGVYINEGMNHDEFMALGHDEYFHRQSYTNDFDELTSDLTQLCREVMF